jgi:AcrR family transcriptional regulator
MPRSTPVNPSGKRTPITTELLVDTAIELIEADGLEALSMRRLADRFGIQAASVYWYVASKDQMLDLAVDRLLGMAFEKVFVENLEQRAVEQEDSRQKLRRIGLAYRAFLLAHPDSAKVISSRQVVSANLAAMLEPLLTLFAEAGLDEQQASQAGYLLLDYVQGFVLQETAPLSIPSASPGEDRSTTLKQMEAVLSQLEESQFPRTRAAAAFLAKPDLPMRFSFGLDSLLAGMLAAGNENS